VVVRSDLKRRGIATLLLRKMLGYCRGRGTRELVGDVLADNAPMLELVRSQGGLVESGVEDGVVRVAFPLQGAAPPGPG
jgi:ribosomal protein S18 acetylase RimI-like enzyme